MSGAKFCSSLLPVGGTLRQYWYCDLADGHDGEHRALVPLLPTGRHRTTRIVKSWPNPQSPGPRPDAPALLSPPGLAAPGNYKDVQR